MGEDFLLHLARIDVGSAGDVHVGGAASDIDKAFCIHVAEIAGAEPAIAKRLGVGLGVAVVAGEHAGADDADLTGLERLQFAAVITLDRDLHAGALESARADARMRPVVGGVQGRRQHRDIAGDLAEAEILHQHLAELLQRRLLVLAIHRRAGIDDITQR